MLTSTEITKKFVFSKSSNHSFFVTKILGGKTEKILKIKCTFSLDRGDEKANCSADVCYDLNELNNLISMLNEVKEEMEKI